ncbi:DNA repair protein RecO [Dirofilaria immitis]
MAMRRKRRAAEVAREAIRTTMQTIKKKHRKSIRKQPIVHIKKINSIVSQQDSVMVASSESQSNQLAIKAGSNPSTSYEKNGNSLSTQVDDPFYDQLKQLPDKLLVRLPCGVIRDAAEHLKNVNYSALAGFIIFRTDLHPFNQGHKQKIAH